MKAKTKLKKEFFQPITLELTFETAEELKVFKEVFGYDVTVPSSLVNSDILTDSDSELFAKQMRVVQVALIDF